MINVMLCGNNKMYDGLLISTISMIKYLQEPVNMYVVTADLRDVDERYVPIDQIQINKLDEIVKKKNPESNVVLVDITEMFREEMMNTVNMTTHYTPYIFLRLFADKIEELPDKILYLDTDIVCYKDIKELYDTNIDNYEFAAAKDYFGMWFIDRKYMNSGVLLMNLKKMRENNSLSNCRKMCMEKKMLLPDQTALNEVCKAKYYLPRKYNEQKQRSDDTVIRHFSMTIKFWPWFHTLNIKPWNVNEIHEIYKINDFDDVLDEYLKVKGEN